MEYGRINDPKILDQINWQLSDPDPLAAQYLAQYPHSVTHLRMGAPAWSHKEWVGKIYPFKTSASKYLYHYSRYFNTIELNTTHYRIPTLEQTQKWSEQVPPDFLFCPKVFQGISHDRNGLIDPALLKTWLQFLENLKDRRGPCFLQLPPSFDYSWKTLLFKFLQQWPSEFQLAIELRHPTWFHGGVVLPALTQYLQSRGIGLVITDVAGHREVQHSSISADFTMIRFIGNSLHSSDYTRAQVWNARLHEWEKQGLPGIYFFVHQPDDIFVPEMMTYLKQLSFFQSHFANATTSEPEPDLENSNLKFF